VKDEITRAVSIPSPKKVTSSKERTRGFLYLQMQPSVSAHSIGQEILINRAVELQNPAQEIKYINLYVVVIADGSSINVIISRRPQPYYHPFTH
jgi:hypothetical protein